MLIQINDNAKELLRYGKVLAGAVVGSLLTAGTNDPGVQITGSAIGAILPEVLNDFASRHLSEREKIRVGAVGYYAIKKIKTNLDENATINKEFVKKLDNHRSSAEELFEGILIKAKNEAEEKKIKHIGAIFGNAIFVEDISPDDVNHLLSLVDRLTYRKMCVMAFYNRIQDLNSRDIMDDSFSWYPNIKLQLTTRATLQDILELDGLGIMDLNLLTPSHIHLMPRRHTLSELGKKYYQLMSLDEIDISDIEPIINALEYKEEYGRSSYGKKNGRSA